MTGFPIRTPALVQQIYEHTYLVEQLRFVALRKCRKCGRMVAGTAGCRHGGDLPVAVHAHDDGRGRAVCQ